MEKTRIYENLDNVSLDRFEDFSSETVGEKTWRMSHKKTYQIASKKGNNPKRKNYTNYTKA